jgi:hypothetical protein
MAAKGNVEVLSKSLAEAVGWEEAMMQGVAEAIAAAGSREEVDELVRVSTLPVANDLLPISAAFACQNL